MTKHTPGPWKYTISAKHNRPQISGKDGHQICLLWRDGEMEANARLIAAAPELLEALKNLANQTVINEYNGHCFTAARKAIAKAEGA